jgi:hypothetical protein
MCNGDVLGLARYHLPDALRKWPHLASESPIAIACGCLLLIAFRRCLYSRSAVEVLSTNLGFFCRINNNVACRGSYDREGGRHLSEP